MGILNVLFQSRCIELAEELELSETLITELGNLDADRKQGGENDILWREKEHEDVTFGLAIAAWYATRDSRGKLPKPATVYEEDEKRTDEYNPLRDF